MDTTKVSVIILKKLADVPTIRTLSSSDPKSIDQAKEWAVFHKADTVYVWFHAFPSMYLTCWIEAQKESVE
jgi:hypothetical protein